jgi:hypothetical protein
MFVGHRKTRIAEQQARDTANHRISFDADSANVAKNAVIVALR